MKIITADDELLALEMLTDLVKTAAPDAEVFSFSKPQKIVEWAENNTADVAFLDIRMRGMTGLELAEKLKDKHPDLNIIFVTGYDEYALPAMSIHASGYVMKPITEEKVRKELQNLRFPIAKESNVVLKAKCFGNFDAFDAKGNLIKFGRSKSKELLAYLILRAGASCTIRELAGILFEDSDFDSAQQAYMQQIITAMNKALRENGAESAIIRSYNSLAVDAEKIECDYYMFKNGDKDILDTYEGEFMAQYSWAEYVSGYLDRFLD